MAGRPPLSERPPWRRTSFVRWLILAVVVVVLLGLKRVAGLL